MKPAPFDYYRPYSTEDVLSALADMGEGAKILAGGQSLTAMLNLRLARPQALIDINFIDELTNIIETDGYIEIGAAVTQEQLLQYANANDDFPLLKLVLPWTGHYQTRQRGTVCGSLVHSDPSSELPLCLKLLQGEMVIQSKKRKRIVPASDFQLGLLETDVQPGEFVTAVRFPKKAQGSQFAFREISQRHGDFAIVAIALERTDNQDFKIGIAGVADTPTTKVLKYDELSECDDILNNFSWELGGADDVHASARYRRDLVRDLGKAMINEMSET